MRPLSARNPRIQRLGRLVRRRGERAEQRAFVVEGPVLIDAALDVGGLVLDLYVDEGALDRPVIDALVARAERAGVVVWSVPEGVLERIGDTATSQGALAVVSQVDAALPRPSAGAVGADTNPFVVVLADLADPGNVGTLLRAAVAAGAAAVVVAGGVDPTNPKVVRASAGAVFSVPVVSFADPATAVAGLRDAGYALVGTVVRDGEPYDRVRYDEATALVLGNEAHGLDADTAASLDRLVTIPMAGPTESLNVAMAGTVLCFEVLRQRRST
jgi:TrmH family RNA methyltransferase